MEKKYILIIEDDKSLRDALKDRLLNEGFGILEARNGEEGLFVALDKKPDLILLDIVMPRMDGITMLDKLRKEEAGKNIPVIMLTNLEDTENVGSVVEKGVTNYLVKSNWKIDEVVSKIEKALESK